MQQDVELHSMWLNAQEIMKEPAKGPCNYTAIIHTERSDVEVIQIHVVDDYRDYANNISSVKGIIAQVGFGTYVYRIYPHRHNLECTIVQIKKGKQIRERYKAILDPTKNRAGAGEGELLYSEGHLNNIDLVDVELELIDRSAEVLKIKTVSGIYPNTDMTRAIKSLMIGESQKVLVDGNPAVDGIDVYPASNVSNYKHLNISEGVHISALPTYLHTNMGGVYSAGIGTYLQTYNEKKIWFIYPLYDYTRFDSGNDRVIFYNIPNDRLNGIDSTYKKEGALLKILSTSKSKMTDRSDIGVMNEGVGFRMPDARAYMGKPVLMTEDGPVGSRTRLTNEVIHKSRKDGLNYAPVVKTGASSNPFLEYSKVLEREANRLDLTWSYSDPSLIYPGMPCQYQFPLGDKIGKISGTILFIYTTTAKVSKNAFVHTSKITVALGPDENQRIRPNDRAPGGMNI